MNKVQALREKELQKIAGAPSGYIGRRRTKGKLFVMVERDTYKRRKNKQNILWCCAYSLARPYVDTYIHTSEV